SSRRDLQVSYSADSKTYDGTATATVHESDDRVSGDVVTVSYSTALFSDKNVGTGKTVTVSGIGISSTDAGNYHLVNSSATATATIRPPDLHVRSSAHSKHSER